MQGYVRRELECRVREHLEWFPAVAIIGSRQCGKSTMAKVLLAERENALYLDLEKPSDRRKLDDTEAFFALNEGRLICLDEIQRVPGVFECLRSVLDERGKNGQLLLLGSASPELLRQSSESLAGRISYLELTPLLRSEITEGDSEITSEKLWMCGGYPRSLLASSIRASTAWRQSFIRTFLERDIPNLGIRIPSASMERLFSMCAHIHGNLLNASKIASSLAVSNHTVRSHLDLLEQTYLLRLLMPYHANLKKRLIKSPKVYLRDTGLLHSLLRLHKMNDLLGHPSYGSSWEGFVIENVITSCPDWKPYFYRTRAGAEIDLLLEKGQKRVAIEIKVSSAPTIPRGYYNAIEDLKIQNAFVVAPVKESYPVRDGVLVTNLLELIARLKTMT